MTGRPASAGVRGSVKVRLGMRVEVRVMARVIANPNPNLNLQPCGGRLQA